MQSNEKIIQWDEDPLKITLEKYCEIGKDSLKLFFSITENADFHVKCFTIDEEDIGEFNLGKII